MPVTAEGPLSLVLEKFRLMLADCVSVRTFLEVDEASSEEALARIYADALPPPEHDGEFTREELTAMRPFVLIEIDDTGSGFHAFLESEGTHSKMAFQGAIHAIFEKEIDPEDLGNPADYTAKFRNEIGNIFSQLAQRSGLGTWLILRQIWISGPVQPEPEEQVSLGNAIRYFMRIEWGRSR